MHRGGTKRVKGAAPIQKCAPVVPPNALLTGCIVQCLCSSFSDADVEFDFVLMTSAYTC